MSITKFTLSHEKQKRLEDLQADIDILEDEIRKAKEVGLDVSKVEAQIKASKILKDNILKVYGT